MKKIGKYLIRSVKYFIFISLLLTVILSFLVISGLADGNPEVMFKNGYDSLRQIALMFGAVALFYPKFGYGRKEAVADGTYDELRNTLIEYMKTKNYTLVKETGNEILKFRDTRIMKRILKLREDEITVKKVFGGFEFEGLRRDIIGLANGYRYRMENNK